MFACPTVERHIAYKLQRYSATKRPEGAVACSMTRKGRHSQDRVREIRGSAVDVKTQNQGPTLGTWAGVAGVHLASFPCRLYQSAGGWRLERLHLCESLAS